MRQKASQIFSALALRAVLPAALIVAAVGAAILAAKRVSSTKRYNVVLISLDTLRADRLGVYGYNRVTTPSLDQFARRGVIFTNSYSNANITLPSHLSLLTGVYPVTHKMHMIARYNKPGFELSARSMKDRRNLAPEIKTLAEYLRAAGYQTASFYDIENEWLHPSYGFYRGFDEVHPYGLDSLINLELISDWFKKRPKKPFFAFIHSRRVHDPYLVDESVLQMFGDPTYKGKIPATHEAFQVEFDKFFAFYTQTFCGLDKKDMLRKYNACAQTKAFLAPTLGRLLYWRLVDEDSPADQKRLSDMYDGAVFHTDRLFGLLMKQIVASDLFNDTIFIVTSDHGEAFKEHGFFSHYSLNHEATHVPLIVVFPRNLLDVEPPPQSDALSQGVDILPTVLDALGIKPTHKLDGRSLVPALAGKKLPGGERVFGFSAQPHQAISVRTSEWSYIHHITGKRELYSRATDRLEQKDVYEENRQVARNLEAMIVELLAQNGESL